MAVSKSKLSSDAVDHNRRFFLDALRSGQFTKGTTQSDENGRPVITSPEDEDGHCACALMSDLFLVVDGVKSSRNYLRALDLTPAQCRYIQQDINDTPLTFAEIADRIEAEVFKRDQK